MEYSLNQLKKNQTLNEKKTLWKNCCSLSLSESWWTSTISMPKLSAVQSEVKPLKSLNINEKVISNFPSSSISKWDISKGDYRPRYTDEAYYDSSNFKLFVKRFAYLPILLVCYFVLLFILNILTGI